MAESLNNDLLSSGRRIRQTNEGDYQGGLTQDSSDNEQASGQADEQVGELGQDLEATSGYQGTSAGALNNANQAQSSGKSTQMLGLAMGVGFAAICRTPTGGWACAPAAMSFMDALAAGRGSNDAGYTGTFLDPSTGLPAFEPSGDFDDVYNTQAVEGLQDLQAMGYSFNEDGSVTTPSGENITSADLASKSALMKKGFSEKQASQAMQKMGAIKASSAKQVGLDPEALASGTEVAVAGAGGSGGGGAAGSFETSGQGGADQIIEEIEYRGKAKKDNRMPASKAAEFSKNFNGTPIGIGMANLFLIVHKKYSEKKDKKTEFINKEY